MSTWGKPWGRLVLLGWVEREVAEEDRAELSLTSRLPTVGTPALPINPTRRQQCRGFQRMPGSHCHTSEASGRNKPACVPTSDLSCPGPAMMSMSPTVPSSPFQGLWDSCRVLFPCCVVLHHKSLLSTLLQEVMELIRV